MSEGNHCLLLGEPGSGKTTTLKRLAQRLLFDAPTTEADIFNYPLVIRLRDLEEGESLFLRLAKIFELSFSQREIITRVEAKAVKTSSGAPRGRGSAREIRHIETRIGNRRIEDVIPEFLNQSEALVLLDGLDEVRAGSRADIRKEIVQLGRRLTSSKIIVSCRSGDYVSQMEGFAVLELCALTDLQIEAIKTKWLGTSEDRFLEDLKRLPYYDLTDRPLLLTQLLFLYKRFGYLPEQPAMVYKKVLRLLLEDWDAERDITRSSKYAGFDPERKAEFLSALAYHLTYSQDEKSFTEKDLIAAYLAIYRPFNLPKTEAIQVAREIQTITGVVIAGPRDTYEFCHLSVQEYLCANYLVRAPALRRIGRYMAAYSAPLAVAVTLSSKPGDWLANIILTPGNLQLFEKSSMSSFLARLRLERPFFELSEPLAFAVFRLVYFFRDSEDLELQGRIADLLEMDGVLDSLALAMRWYQIEIREDNSSPLALLRLRRGYESVYDLEPPTTGAVPLAMLHNILERSEVRIMVQTRGGRTGPLTMKKALELSDAYPWPSKDLALD